MLDFFSPAAFSDTQKVPKGVCGQASAPTPVEGNIRRSSDLIVGLFHISSVSLSTGRCNDLSAQPPSRAPPILRWVWTVCVCVCGSVSVVWVCTTKTPDRNDLKLGTVSSTMCHNILILGSKEQGLGLWFRVRVRSGSRRRFFECVHIF